MSRRCGLASCGLEVPPSGGGCSRCQAIAYCGVAHQRADWRRHREECTPPPAYRVAEVEGKGRGLVATRTLEVGDLVISEKPLLKMPDPYTDVTSTIEDYLLNEFGKLSEALKARVLDMRAGVYGQDVLGKFTNNALIVEGMGTALYDNIAYMNHSCSPNVFVTEEETKKVRVFRRIKEGEEIVAGYVGPNNVSTREERVKAISEQKGFVCRCRLCSLTGDDLKQNDITRRIIRDLRKRVCEAIDSKEYALAFETSEQMVEVMEMMKDELILVFSVALSKCSWLAVLVGRKEAEGRYRERYKALVTTLGREFKMKIEEVAAN